MAGSTAETVHIFTKFLRTFKTKTEDEDILESKLNSQTLPPTRKPTEETRQVPAEHSALPLPDVSQPDLQPALPSVPAPASSRSGRAVRRPAYLKDFTT